jgi:hypothetical protein
VFDLMEINAIIYAGTGIQFSLESDHVTLFDVSALLIMHACLIYKAHSQYLLLSIAGDSQHKGRAHV